MDLQLQNAVVIVTGASRGLGRDIAIAFAEEGASVAICARDMSQLQSVATLIVDAGGKCLPIQADLLIEADCQHVVDETVSRFGRLDVLINNASAIVDNTPTSIEDATDGQVLARVSGKTMVAIRCSPVLPCPTCGAATPAESFA